MKIEYPVIGICGLSCNLCPRYHTEAKSRCQGCKSPDRMAAGCPFITCARKQGVEFCWDCQGNQSCEKWAKHRELGKQRDSFKCYQKLESDIAQIQAIGIKEFYRLSRIRERLLVEMLQEFNAGRSKNLFCIAATVLEIDELRTALARARHESAGMGIKERAKMLQSILAEIAEQQDYCLKLRK